MPRAQELAAEIAAAPPSASIETKRRILIERETCWRPLFEAEEQALVSALLGPRLRVFPRQLSCRLPPAKPALARDSRCTAALGHARPAIGAVSPVGPALQEPPPTSVRSLTAIVGRVGKNQVTTARRCSRADQAPARTAPRRRPLRSRRIANPLPRRAGYPVVQRLQGGVTPFFMLSSANPQLIQRAGQPGLEPGIAGFGDRCLSQFGHCPSDAKS